MYMCIYNIYKGFLVLEHKQSFFVFAKQKPNNNFFYKTRNARTYILILIYLWSFVQQYRE